MIFFSIQDDDPIDWERNIRLPNLDREDPTWWMRPDKAKNKRQNHMSKSQLLHLTFHAMSTFQKAATKTFERSIPLPSFPEVWHGDSDLDDFAMRRHIGVQSV